MSKAIQRMVEWLKVQRAEMADIIAELESVLDDSARAKIDEDEPAVRPDDPTWGVMPQTLAKVRLPFLHKLVVDYDYATVSAALHDLERCIASGRMRNLTMPRAMAHVKQAAARIKDEQPIMARDRMRARALPHLLRTSHETFVVGAGARIYWRDGFVWDGKKSTQEPAEQEKILVGYARKYGWKIEATTEGGKLALSKYPMLRGAT